MNEHKTYTMDEIQNYIETISADARHIADLMDVVCRLNGEQGIENEQDRIVSSLIRLAYDLMDRLDVKILNATCMLLNRADE